MFGEVLPPIDLLQVNLQLFAALLFSLSLQGFLFSGFLMVLVNFPNNTGVVVSGFLFPFLHKRILPSKSVWSMKLSNACNKTFYEY